MKTTKPFMAALSGITVQPSDRCCISLSAGHGRSTTAGLHLNLPAGGPQKSERPEVSNNRVIVVKVWSLAVVFATKHTERSVILQKNKGNPGP